MSKVLPPAALALGLTAANSAVLNFRFQTAIAPTLLEPDLLARTNILSHPPPVIFQGLELIAVGAEPQRDALPLAVWFRQRDRHSMASILSNRYKRWF